MGTLLFVFCALALMIRSGTMLRLAKIFKPDSVMEVVSRQQTVLGRKLFWVASHYGGLRIEMERSSLPALPPVFLFVSNHQSLADIVALPVAFPYTPIRFVAKKELGRGIPYVSVALRFGRHALVSRKSDFRRGHRVLLKLADLSAQGICPAIYPEGSRSRTGAVQPFHAGAFRVILERAPLPVLSVAVDGGYRISTIRHILTNLRTTVYRFKPLTLYPAPHGKNEILDLLARVEQEIKSQVREWRKPAGAGSPAFPGQKKPIQ